MSQYQKGELVHTFSTTLKRRRERESHDGIQRVLIDDEAVEKGETYIFEVSRVQKGRNAGAEPFEFEATIHNTDYSFSIPKQVAKENDIYPGDYLTFNIFTREEKDGQEDIELSNTNGKKEDRFLDNINIYSTSNSPDGIASRVYSSECCEYLGDKTKPLLLLNKRNGKEETFRTSANESGNRFTLPINVRRRLELEDGDVCEVYKVNNSGEPKGIVEDNTKERIEEIYQMVSELYEAYDQNN